MNIYVNSPRSGSVSPSKRLHFECTRNTCMYRQTDRPTDDPSTTVPNNGTKYPPRQPIPNRAILPNRARLQTDGRTDGQTDRVIPVYPP